MHYDIIHVTSDSGAPTGIYKFDVRDERGSRIAFDLGDYDWSKSELLDLHAEIERRMDADLIQFRPNDFVPDGAFRVDASGTALRWTCLRCSYMSNGWQLNLMHFLQSMQAHPALCKRSPGPQPKVYAGVVKDQPNGIDASG